MIIPGNYVPGKILLGWSSGFYLAVQKRALANDRQIRFQRFRPDSRSYPRRLTTRWNLYRCCCHRCFYFASTSAVSSSVCVPLDRPRACSPRHHLPFLSFFIVFSSSFLLLLPSFHVLLKRKRKNTFVFIVRSNVH